ncbi:Glycosyltransferase involved in cell wall bisynthesis [Pustulibacterium marinum]|uniref:Glycosyltransferase involved in cell wall bisynthesis n=1 Tax=Pustulibacterium marinum TaxID=1224947 RepID=A0A1I7FW65_9FLAO|nr:glycosyltransferase [Pustulibacterium marinum]SFU40391.1 Glycosyltransferase involved in cell wall bisynthesis [Pustulibacterium marinum]
MIQNIPKKICLLTDVLSHGGAEKVCANLSIALANAGYEVSIICLQDKVKYAYAGKLINLGENLSQIKILQRLQWVFRIRKAIKNIDADYYIDFRYRRGIAFEGLLHLIAFPMRRMIFSMQHARIEYHKPNGKFFDYFYNKAFSIVAVSSEIQTVLEQDYGFKNVDLIYNFSDFSKNLESVEATEKYVISVGRLNPIKQLDKLILAYSKSNLPQRNIHLYIFGEGEQKQVLEDLIMELKLTDLVKLKGFTDRIHSYIKASEFLILASKNEGFPMVLVESLQLGTPIISFDCKTGPSEIIQDEENGLLIEDQNFEALIVGMNRLITDEELYKQCKANAQTSITKFSKEKVIEQWLNLLD